MKRPRYEIFVWGGPREPRYGFRLIAANGEVVSASTQGYQSERDAKRGIRAHRRAALLATVRMESPS